MEGQPRVEHRLDAPLHDGQLDCPCGGPHIDSPVARICGVSRGPADAERTIEMFACIVSQSQSSVVIYSRDLLQSYLNSVGVR